MTRNVLLVLSILSIGYYGYSFYTLLPDLPFNYRLQNIFTILMCSLFTFLLFASTSKELRALLNNYYLTFRMKAINIEYSYSLMFSFAFISYAHFWITTLSFNFILSVIAKFIPLYSYMTLDSSMYINLFANYVFFISYAIPVVYVFIKLMKKQSINH